MSQGPLPIAWAQQLSVDRGLWGRRLVDEMNRANHALGLKLVGEVLPYEHNQVALADDVDSASGFRASRSPTATTSAP
jgi:hypothetical protein